MSNKRKTLDGGGQEPPQAQKANAGAPGAPMVQDALGYLEQVKTQLPQLYNNNYSII